MNIELNNNRNNLKCNLTKLSQEIKLIINHQSQINQAKKITQQKINEAKDNYFISGVTSALNLIKEEKINKIVIAHAFDYNLPEKFNLIESLNHLRQKHPDCYIFSLSNGKGDYFIGASPERLLSIENQQLVTDALAGSAPRGKNKIEDLKIAKRLINSDKEIREHQAVSEFILQRLCQLGLKPEQGILSVKQLANIQHLWTPILAELPANLNPLEIVSQLHPTPAVAGVPIDLACEQIQTYEPFERGLYAAPLGWIDYQGNSKFIVGIRSALISGNQARLYAGAGIVKGSDPKKEFAEVRLKLQSLLSCLF
jgi:menaquinone-specific isochorismate synthase